MQQHLVTCGLCPEAAKEPFRENVATSRAAEARLGKRSMDENSARLEEAATEGAAPKTGLKFMRPSAFLSAAVFTTGSIAPAGICEGCTDVWSCVGVDEKYS